MAKQLINPIERHIEKAIVGVGGLLLIGAFARFAVTSPNTMELGGETVTPSTIDARVAQKARQIQERIRNARVDVESFDALADNFSAALSPIEADRLPRVVRFGPEVPLIDRPETPIGQKELVKVVKPEPPEVAYGRSTLEVENAAGFSYQITDWVTVSAIFNVKQQADVQKIAYGAQFNEIIFGPFELQRRTRRPDGSWSDDDWVTIEPRPAGQAPIAPDVALVRDGENLIVPRTTVSAIEQYYALLSRSDVQLSLLRPLMHPVANGTPWAFPILTTYVDVLKQDDQYLFPDQPPTDFPEDRYGLHEQPVAPEAQEKTVADELAEIEKAIELAKKTCDPNMAVDAHNNAFDLAKRSTISASERERAGRLKLLAEQAEADISRAIALGRCGAGARGTGEADEEYVRAPLPVQQFWLHDAQRGSVLPGGAYQYRCRAQVFNQLAGDPTKFAADQDATRVLVAGEWSDPSAPLTIPRDVEFFVTAADDRKKEVGVEVFQWSDGVWVKDRFRYGVGDAVRGQSRQKVPRIDDPSTPMNALIEFDARVTLVAVDFKRTFRDHKRGKTRSGLAIGSPQPACAVAYVDGDGDVKERLVPVDKAHPSKRAAAERVDRGSIVWQE